MEFDYLHKIANHAMETHGYYISDIDKFYLFIDEFSIERVHWGEPTTISASYFLRLLKDGSSARARYTTDDEHSNEMSPFYTHLLDHGVMWKLKSGSVICTALPYGDHDTIYAKFCEMKEKLDFPDSVRVEFVDEKYRFRENGDCMILIYFDPANEEIEFNCSDEELRRKAFLHSSAGRLRYQTTSSYVRDRYLSEYVKRRAHGVCQLCERPAPFIDKNGNPFLESHHIIWLSDGGSDSIENMVALCPNCHKMMHNALVPDEVIEKLQRVAMMN